MNRRLFITASTAGLALAASAPTRAAAGTTGKDLIELRIYTFDTAEQLKAFDQFLERAAIPALNQAGVKPVGVFTLRKEDNDKLGPEADIPRLYIIMPHKSAESVASLVGRLTQDSTFMAAGDATLKAPKATPAYKRFESSLLLGFDEAPHVEVVSKSPKRLLQLRIYESHNDERALKKIEMFNQGGEIAVFRRCGMPPVFFGQAIVGSKLPNLTYALAFDDEEAQKKAWDTFGKDPDWKRLREDPAYADTVSNITNLVLRPMPSSQI